MSVKKNIAIYSISNFLNASIPFVLLPVLTSVLNEKEYGVLSLFQVTVAFVFPLVIVQIQGAIRVTYFKINKNDIPSYISSALLIPLVSTTCIIIIFYCLKNLIFQAVAIPENWIIVIPVFAFLQVISNVVLVLFQVKEQPLKYGIFVVCQTLINFFLSMTLILKFQLGWEGRLYGIFITYLLFSIIGIIVVYKLYYLTTKIKKAYVFDSLRFGFPLIPHAIGCAIIPISSRYLLANMVGLDAAGMYTVGFQVASIMLISVTSINQAFSPYLYKKLNFVSEHTKVMLVKNTYSVFLLMSILFIILMLFTPILFELFIDEKFQNSIKFVFWIGLGFLFQGFYFMVVNYIFYEKKTHLLAILTFGNALVNIILTYIFIKLYGTIGAAYSFSVSFLLYFITAWILSNKVCPMPWGRTMWR